MASAMQRQGLLNPRPLLAALLCATLAAGCIKPYRMDIQQGNLITEKEVMQLKRGMSKREVRYVMGTPLVVDPFHTDRWDYYYSFLGNRDKKPQRRRVTVVFVGDRLDHIDGDVVAATGLEAEDAVPEDETGGTRVTTESGKADKGLMRKAWEKVWGGGRTGDDLNP